MSVNISAKENNFWTEVIKGSTIIWYKGYFFNYSITSIIGKCTFLDSKEIDSFIKSIDGHFAIIVQRSDLSFIAVDKIRSTPLFYYSIGDDFFIDYNPLNLVKQDNFDRTINENSKIEISMSGYTIGNKTIYKKLHSLKAGEIVFFSNGIVKSIKYHKYFSNIEKKGFQDFKSELSELTLNIFRKTIKSIGDRQVVIPLSAGNDSRLVASVLRHLDVRNVKCFTYGIKDNFEANISKKIAQKLNYDWIFVDLNDHLISSVFNTSRISEYFNYYETFTSCPCIQGLLSLEYLKSNNLVDDDAIFINGNSGDFISGGHINGLSFFSSTPSYEDRKKKILNKLVNKHFSLWGNLKSKKNIQIIKHNLWMELISDLGDLDPSSTEKDHLFYEYSEFVGRQSKYVISCQKAFEFYNHEWKLPLWDDQFLDFFVKVPLEFKLNQKLYKEMLIENNWGGVWTDDIPVNKKTIRPKWVFYSRLLTKPFFLIFGLQSKAFWHIFDRSFFYYWMDISRMIRIVNFSKFFTSIFKRPRHHVSFLSERYLKNFHKS